MKVKDELVNLYQEAYKDLEDYHYTDIQDIQNYINWLHSHNKETSLIILAFCGKEIIGFIAGDTYYYDKEQSCFVSNIHELVVKPEFRGLGIGTHLIYEFITRAKNKNKQLDKKVNQVILWVGKNNQKAIKFYTNLGFSVHSKTNKWIKMKMNI